MTRFNDEDGFALMTALLAVIILSGLAVVFVARATAETKASGFSQDFESTIHTAEAAADIRIAALNADDGHVTHNITGLAGAQDVIDGTFASERDERRWILDQGAALAGTDAWAIDGQGESFAFRPGYVNAAGDLVPLDVIYAAGATPSFDHERGLTRVVKLQVGKDYYRPRVALLTGGDLTFGGNASILAPGCDASGAGCIADVHVNGDLANPGSASVIEGEVRVSDGTCPSAINATNGCVDGAAALPVPAFRARDFYLRTLNGTSLELASVDWYDLCPDGTVRAPAEDGPCLNTSTVIWPAADLDASNYLGWEFRAAQNTWRASALQSGTFYVYGADAEVTGTAPGTQSTSILVEAVPTQLGTSGTLALGGNPQMDAALDDILFITDADLKTQGTPSGGTDACAGLGASYGGFIGVGEQLAVGGNVRVAGAIIVQDATENHGEVQRTNAGVSGNMCLEFDPKLALDFSGVWVVRYWSEL